MAQKFFVLAIMTLSIASAVPQARADGSEGAGLQVVTEAIRQQAIQADHSGWSNGTARLTNSGTGYSVAYSGTPEGSAGHTGVASIFGNDGGSPIIAYGPETPSGTMVARR
ncbi:hypothetical protein [Paracraurococcus ruber]|uniref:hypothetical protein n=1 Tax=Paracraurococcus ruber TaxID=77675 RepID=UPI0010579B7D|nr:hypothetical protein [Paracraurococcus ruber]TDG27337.1 hypothetical protein E2C05_23270 [Paracraurococcus ruber]